MLRKNIFWVCNAIYAFYYSSFRLSVDTSPQKLRVQNILNFLPNQQSKLSLFVNHRGGAETLFPSRDKPCPTSLSHPELYWKESFSRPVLGFCLYFFLWSIRWLFDGFSMLAPAIGSVGQTQTLVHCYKPLSMEIWVDIKFAILPEKARRNMRCLTFTSSMSDQPARFSTFIEGVAVSTFHF